VNVSSSRLFVIGLCNAGVLLPNPWSNGLLLARVGLSFVVHFLLVIGSMFAPLPRSANRTHYVLIMTVGYTPLTSMSAATTTFANTHDSKHGIVA